MAASTARVLYLNQDDAEIWSIAPDGADRQRRFSFPPGRHPARLVLSPDGKQMAYALPDDDTTLYLAMLDQRTDQILTLPRQAQYIGLVPQAFSPDGRQLAFDRTLGPPGRGALGSFAALWTVVLATGEAREITSALGDPPYVDAPAWLDNRHLLYRDGRGNTMRIATTPPATPDLVTAGWILLLGPDRTLMLARDRYSFDDLDLQNLSSYRLVTLEGQPGRQLREWRLPWSEFSWSPDGARIALFSPGSGRLQLLHRDNDTIEDVRTVDRVRPDIPPITGTEYLRLPLLWTPDGQSLLYLVETQAQVELRRFDLVSRAEQMIAILDRQSELLALVP
jgi:Tol biopolymer transport system component